MTATAAKRPPILYSCYFQVSRAGEQFVSEHILSYQVAGTLLTNDGTREQAFGPGTLRLMRRNHLLKFAKLPGTEHSYKNLSIVLDQDTLRRLSLETGYEPGSAPPPPAEAVVSLPADPLYLSYVASLQPYEQLAAPGNEDLLQLKVREAALLLIRANPELRAVLFDFAEPGKLDLAAFMERNFHFNVQLPRFAYLTGRSLATFKRDFEKIFHVSPSRWLLRRRLQEAHYRIKEQGQTASEVYLDLGFEDLSHFSYAFKKQYGVAPSRLTA
ncbi:AraC family transcriptional regulator [Hymenobacter sp. 15J16-1T3B]|uniref:helix-turn-helix domain-containing protein n=1 Tax=Hymenobacter sp. 15J16-1T3B TaxID=2886941 RepID=UPI001D11A466|nr:AraC family transcriptional regulator [Hymenobacter sp. 15J16-1T3B]MCC3156760.1 AraC family transcriptional regulator [Hymenobacter sp. 15J16-1T3B]